MSISSSPSLHVHLSLPLTFVAFACALPSFVDRTDPSVAPGVVWASGIHRQWLGVSLGEEVEVEAVDLGGKGTWLGGLDLEVSRWLFWRNESAVELELTFF